MTQLPISHSANDTILLEMGQASFEKMIGEVLKLAREGDILALSTLPLAHASLVDDSFLIGESISSDARGRAILSILAWAVDRLRPDGEQSWVGNAWRNHNILQAFYIEGVRASELAERMAISEQTLYQSRPQAISNVAHILREEIQHPADKQNRQRYALTARYNRHGENEKKLLRIASVFSRSAPVSLLHDLFQKTSENGSSNAGIQTSIHQLIGQSVLIGNDAGTEAVLRPEMRSYLQTLLSPEERGQLHTLAADYYAEKQEFLESAQQLQMAGKAERSAETLILNKQKFFDNLQIEELSEFVGRFSSADLSGNLWAKLKIVAGEIAEFSKEIDVALNEYQQALSAPNVQIKALAYYRRARAFERKNVGESLAHYSYAIRLMEDLLQNSGEEEIPELLAQMYIGRAWIYIQIQPDVEKAVTDLNRSEKLTSEDNRAAWADLHNAYGFFYQSQNGFESASQHFRQAWLAANEVQDITRMTNTAHNLGGLLSKQGDFEQALHYLTQSLELSSKSNNRQMQGLCNLSIGACHFWQDQFAEAIEDYHAAQRVFEETGNHTLALRAYFNLAEAYAELPDLSQARHYFEQGYAQAQTLQDEGAIREFLTLAQSYPNLQTSKIESNLNERQQQALLHIQTDGKITNRGYQDLTEVSQKQAVRDLNEMVELGLIERKGKGRSTHYVVTQGS